MREEERIARYIYAALRLLKDTMPPALVDLPVRDDSYSNGDEQWLMTVTTQQGKQITVRVEGA